MKKTKYMMILCMLLAMAAVCAMPATFSWYAHDGNINYLGNTLGYTKGNLPLSLQQGGGLEVTTKIADAYGKVSGDDLSSFADIAANSTQRYVSTITNKGDKPVYVNLEMNKITNDAKVYVGVTSPVVNEKSYASRATSEKVDWDYEVIYFEPRRHYDWWKEGVNYNTPNSPYCDQASGITYDDTNNTVTGDNDLNLEYYIGGEGQYMPMEACPTVDYAEGGNYTVYRAFVTTEADSLFFFNHYYVTEDSNKEWNRTPTVNDFAEGRVYYLNGGTNSYNNKDLSYHDNHNDTNICVYYYYKTVTMASGKTANIGLSKGTKDMIGTGESYDYLGKTITYAVKSGSSKNASGTTVSDSSVITVSKDGLITAKMGGSAVVQTTITGEFGDTLTLETNVTIPATIPQVPIAQNIKIPAGGSVDVSWYVKNDTANAASFKNIFLTV